MGLLANRLFNCGLVECRDGCKMGDGSLHALLFALTFGGLDTDLLVILLEGGEILTGLGELSLYHTLSDVPMDEGTLGVHEIELVVNSGEDLSDGSGVGDHADGAHDLGEVTPGTTVGGW